MFHTVDFISCHVSTIFADGDTICKFHHRVISRVSKLYVILTTKENMVGPRTVTWGTPLLMSINLCYSIKYDSLFSVIQKGNDPVDDIGIYACCLKFIRDNVIIERCWMLCQSQMTIPIQRPLPFPIISGSNAGTWQAPLWCYSILCLDE